MKSLLLLPCAALLMAAAPQSRQLSLAVPAQDGSTIDTGQGAFALAAPVKKPRYEPAPLPNRDLNGPRARASNEPSLSPTLFTTKTQYRGDGFSPGSTAQSEQERRAKPGAGFSLHMPFAPN